MARFKGKKKGRPIFGWLVVDKPSGLGSTPVLNEIKRLFKADKAGHAGTLDPLASGALPIAFGNATKLINFAQDSLKTYDFTVTWGESRTTDDADGETLETADFRPSQSDIQAIIPNFLGEIMQTPPFYSAVKIDGERAYDLAREGHDFVIQPRPVTFHKIELIEILNQDEARFSVLCGKGSYIRSLARDMALALGTHGYVSALRRLSVGAFDEKMMIPLDYLRELGHKDDNYEALDALIHPPETTLDDIPGLAVGEGEAISLRQGRPILLRGRDAPVDLDNAWVSLHGKLMAVGWVEAGMFYPRKMLRGG